MQDKKLEDYSKEELISIIKSIKKQKKFGLVWEDKPEKVATDCKEKLPVLNEDASKAISKAPGQPTNIIIEGDNYHSLSALNYTHSGKIDVIYIDPPYNTGNKDFIYNDRYVDKEDAFKHSKWLSFSENVTCGKRKSMADGKVYMSYKHFLGYERGDDGKPKINEEEAKTVRRIYSMFLKGMGYREIADALDKAGIPTPMHGKCWRVRTIVSILSNEKYKGDALLQKTYAVDWLNKKRGKNNGQLPQYYIEGSHPAIISKETFDLVQEEIAKRKQETKRSTSIFANKIICGDCGAYYGRKVWHSKTKYKSYIWFCNHKYKGEHVCTTPNIQDEQIKAAFMTAFNIFIKNKAEYICKARKRIESLTDTANIEKAIEDKETECQSAYADLRALVDENAIRIQNQAEYAEKFAKLETQCRELELEINELSHKKMAISAQREQISQFLGQIESNEIITAFDDDIWCATIENAIIASPNIITFVFKDTSRVTVKFN